MGTRIKSVGLLLLLSGILGGLLPSHAQASDAVARLPPELAPLSAAGAGAGAGASSPGAGLAPPAPGEEVLSMRTGAGDEQRG